MKYREWELDVREGDVFLFRTEWEPFKNPISILSFFVRLFTECPYNHCGIVGKDIDGKLMFYEAKNEGVIANPVEDVLDRQKDKIVQLRPTVVPSTLSERCHVLQGRPYDFKALLVYHLIYRLPKVLIGRFGPWIGPKGDEAESEVVCSELVGEVLGYPEAYQMVSADFLCRPDLYIVFAEPWK